MTTQMPLIRVALLTTLLGVSVYPLHHLVDANFLPLQFALAMFLVATLLQAPRFRRHFAILAAATVYFTAIATYNIDNIAALTSNPIPLTITTLLVLSLAGPLRQRHFRTLDSALALLFLLFSLISGYLNVEHVLTFGFESRTKGFGSGTLYAVLSVISILYYSDRYKNRDINGLALLLLIAVPVWSLLLTQSRGATLTLFAGVLVMNLRSLQSFGRFLVALTCAAAAILALELNVSELGFIRRLIPQNFQDLEHFSSGRIITQLAIVDWFKGETSLSTLAFGNGLNALKVMVNSSFLDLPHLDLLYLLYDGGIASVGMFTLLLFTYASKTSFRHYAVIFILAGLHTNMVASPAYAVLLHFLAVHADEAARRRTQFAPRRKWIAKEAV